MRKIINIFSTMTFIAAFAFVAVATVNVDFTNLSNNTIVSAWDSGLGDGSGGCGSCGGNDGGSYGGGNDAGGGYGGAPADNAYITTFSVYQCTNGATNYPFCNNICVAAAPQTQTLSCATGQTGSITQTRYSYCPLTIGSPVFGSWVTITNTCQNTVVLPTGNIFANPTVITAGQASTISWSSTNADYCVLGTGERVATSGSRVVYPNTTTTYSVICYNNFGQSTVSNATVTVNPVVINNPTANISANPNTILSGNTTTLTWSSTNASYCRLNGGQFNNQNVATSGYVQVSPNVYTNYSITCLNQNGASATDNTFVSVNQNQNLPTVTISPSSYSINQNGPVTLNWSSNNASYCSATPWPFSGSKNISGSEVVTLNNTTTFTITCFNQNGQSAQAQTTVTVNPINYVYCNGVQYPAGTICPNTNNIGVSTTGANPLGNTANIFGYVNPNGINGTMWFEYGTNANSLSNRTNMQNANSAGSFSANITNLSCGTTYYYRAVAQNNNGIRYGNTLSFVTSACEQQVVGGTTVTRPATAVGTNYGQLNGAYVYGNANNNSNCTAYFQYGTNYNLSNTTNPQSLYNNYAVNNFSQALYGLAPRTTYYYRAVTSCVDGVKYGSIMSFTTGGYVAKPVYVRKPVTTVIKSPTICNCNTLETSTSNTNTTTNNASADTIYLDLSVERLESGAQIGGTANYRVTYKNVSSKTLENVAVRVILPSELSVVSADRGNSTVGGSSITFSIPSLMALEEGRMNFTTKVSNEALAGNQISVNAYANYSVPSLTKNGATFKDEITAYVLSVVTNGDTVSANGNNVTNTSSIFGQNFFEWLILAILFLGFILSMVYLFTAAKRRNNN